LFDEDDFRFLPQRHANNRTTLPKSFLLRFTLTATPDFGYVAHQAWEQSQGGGLVVRSCVVVIAVGLLLAGCGIAQRIQAQKEAKEQAARNAELIERSKAAMADCNVKFQPANPKTAVARRKCVNDGFAIQMPALTSDQDLAQRVMAESMAIAEQVQAGKITVVQGNAAVAERWSQAVSESQQRANARNSVAAQQNVAAAQQQAADAANTAAWASMIQAAKNPTVTCVHNANITTCN
jgi:hypothetical protein